VAPEAVRLSVEAPRGSRGGTAPTAAPCDRRRQAMGAMPLMEAPRGAGLVTSRRQYRVEPELASHQWKRRVLRMIDDRPRAGTPLMEAPLLQRRSRRRRRHRVEGRSRRRRQHRVERIPFVDQLGLHAVLPWGAAGRRQDRMWCSASSLTRASHRAVRGAAPTGPPHCAGEQHRVHRRLATWTAQHRVPPASGEPPRDRSATNFMRWCRCASTPPWPGMTSPLTHRSSRQP